jgi:hypothetical protein
MAAAPAEPKTALPVRATRRDTSAARRGLLLWASQEPLTRSSQCSRRPDCGSAHALRAAFRMAGDLMRMRDERDAARAHRSSSRPCASS